jgi:transcriptional regulator of acetoin/glycerol metabolism
MNILEAAYINVPDDQIDYADLPENLTNSVNKTAELNHNERSKIISVLMETTWNKSAAAEKLNWSRMTLYRKLRMYNIVENRKRAADYKQTSSHIYM